MKNPTLTRKQREILVGCILGDVHMRTHNDGNTFACMFEQGNSQTCLHKDYLFHLYDCFQNLCTTQMRPKQVKKTNWAFATKSLASLSFYGNLFYRINPQTNRREKRLPTRPNLLQKLITPVSLAYWFMDDGSIKSKQSKGLILNTHCFTFKEVQLLCEILANKFGLKAKPRKQHHSYKNQVRVYHQIYISGHSFEALTDLIYEHLHPSMLYKWPSPQVRVRAKSSQSIGRKQHERRN